MAKNSIISYEVIEKIGTLDSDSTMPKELRLVSWNNGPDKYDLRSWKTKDDGSEVCGKGLTLDREELFSLYEILKNLFEEDE